MTGAWRGRLALGAVLSALGFAWASLQDMDPDPLGWVLLSTLALSLAALVIDTVDTDRPRWLPTLPPVSAEGEPYDRDRGLLQSHADAETPSAALRDRLVALARARDPGLSDPELATLAASAPRRLTPTEIDHYLTRIEALRDRS